LFEVGALRATMICRVDPVRRSRTTIRRVRPQPLLEVYATSLLSGLNAMSVVLMPARWGWPPSMRTRHRMGSTNPVLGQPSCTSAAWL
jgi:hypothetical protein